MPWLLRCPSTSQAAACDRVRNERSALTFNNDSRCTTQTSSPARGLLAFDAGALLLWKMVHPSEAPSVGDECWLEMMQCVGLLLSANRSVDSAG